MDRNAVVYLIAAHYPCVRPLLTCLKKGRPTAWGDVGPAECEKRLLAENRAFKVILAAYDGETVNFNLPECIPVTFAGKTVDSKPRPIMHFALWQCLHDAINEYRDTIHEAQLVRVPIDSVSRLKDDLDCRTFEALAFRTWGYFLSLFCAPSARLPATLRGQLRRWLPAFSFQLIASDVLKHPLSHTHPFAQWGKFLEAVAGPLSEEAKELISELQPGQAAWFRCGGSAPLDYVLVARHPSNGSFSIRFADAKHHNGVEEAGADLEQEPAGVRQLRVKALQVFAGLQREMRKVLKHKVTLEAFADHHVLIVASRESRQDVNALSPSTFQWHPWSAFLFATERSPLQANSSKK